MSASLTINPYLALPVGLRQCRRGRAPAAVAVDYAGAGTVGAPTSGVEVVPEKKDKGGGGGLEELAVLYDDGFGGVSVKDFFAAARDVNSVDGGPPRWFCPVECGRPVEAAPVLIFLPGLDGVGMGLILHHKPLGKVFEVRCLHIPVNDRTPFEGLLKIVEQMVRKEHSLSPQRPIYLMGDSFGGCLALAVAARNPSIDLVLVLVNPATSFDRTPLQPFFPLLEVMPNNVYGTVPYLLSIILGDPLRMAMVNVSQSAFPTERLEELSMSLTSMLPLLSELADIIPKDTLLWRLKLLKSAAAYTNSRLRSVKAEVLLLASGKDNLLPSKEEADRLRRTLENCRVRYFKDSGHTLLLEDGINMLSVIKGTNLYRRTSKRDYVNDYLPPTITEYKRTFGEDYRWFILATSPVYFSTLSNGEIVRGLAGVPDEGPVLLVGYHNMLGFELFPLYSEFLKEKKVGLRGMAHPSLFGQKFETSSSQISHYDTIALFGGLPVSPTNIYRSLEKKSFVLLYPGGVREALHQKGEEYKLFWPESSEFVRMAARFGATIVPFGAVGEDDVTELVLDYNDQKNIPFLKEFWDNYNRDVVNVRSGFSGDVRDQEMYFPGVLPKVPGRYYYLFGKPIKTRGSGVLEDRTKAHSLYSQVKSEVERILSYLKQKREEDPYRNIAQRTVYQVSWGMSAEVPTFDP